MQPAVRAPLGLVNACHEHGLTSFQGRSVGNAGTGTDVASHEDQTMMSFLDSKLMARQLRQALAERGIALGHGDCLELVARQFGLDGWNRLAARIEAATGGATLDLPRDWTITRQTDQRHYRAGLDPATSGVVRIESRLPLLAGVDLSGDHYASLMQSILAEPYRGRRLRLSAELSTEAADAGSLWMRVDAGPGRVLQFDNMLHRGKHGALRGTAGWTRRSVVLDIPEDAASIHYGPILKGHGRLLARAFELSPVEPDIATTAWSTAYLAAPSNLSFREGAEG